MGHAFLKKKKRKIGDTMEKLSFFFFEKEKWDIKEKLSINDKRENILSKK